MGDVVKDLKEGVKHMVFDDPRIKLVTKLAQVGDRLLHDAEDFVKRTTGMVTPAPTPKPAPRKR